MTEGVLEVSTEEEGGSGMGGDENVCCDATELDEVIRVLVEVPGADADDTDVLVEVGVTDVVGVPQTVT